MPVQLLPMCIRASIQVVEVLEGRYLLRPPHQKGINEALVWVRKNIVTRVDIPDGSI